MKKRTHSHLEDLPIVGPCHLPRGTLDTTVKAVHCDACEKTVHNLSQMSRAEAAELLNGEGPAPCVSYEADPETGLIVYADEDPRRGGPSRLRWIVMAATLGIASAGVANMAERPDAEVKAAMSAIKARLAQIQSQAQSQSTTSEGSLPGGGFIAPSRGVAGDEVHNGVSLAESIESALSPERDAHNSARRADTPPQTTERVGEHIPAKPVEDDRAVELVALAEQAPEPTTHAATPASDRPLYFGWIFDLEPFEPVAEAHPEVASYPEVDDGCNEGDVVGGKVCKR
ncbi:MAG: hypothetical protein ACE366_23280 [Bradymonadia bacterium]